MSYTIHKSDGTAVTVADNNADLNYYSGALPPGVGAGTILIGRNYINYGAPIAQNFLQITENFSSITAPGDAYALQGQLWFEKDAATNSTNGNLHVRVSGATTGGLANWRKIITTDASGGITFDGDITVGTGYKFNGSGAGLTNIPNSALNNSTVTIGSTNIALGGTSTTLAGLTSVTATTFYGSGSGLSGIPNTGLVNSKVTLGTTDIALGSTITTINGLTITGGTFSGNGAGLTNISSTNITAGSITNTSLQYSSISVSGSTGLTVSGSPVSLGGTLTLTNSGVTSIVAGSNITISGSTGAVTINSSVSAGSTPAINPITPKDGDIKVVGSVISIYAAGAWRQVFPAIYS